MNEGVQGVLAPDFVGVLDTNLSVAVEDISRSGCLLETRSTIPVGTVGRLSVDIDGTVYSDNVRVTRCVAIPGGGERHYVGVAFLPLERPGPNSLRLYAASLGKV